MASARSSPRPTTICSKLRFQQAGVGINRVVRGSDVSFIRQERPTLIKLYGDAQQPDTLVVTDRDHSQLLRDRDKEDVIDEVRRAFKRNTILFYGYNLSDPDFKFLFDKIAETSSHDWLMRCGLASRKSMCACGGIAGL